MAYTVDDLLPGSFWSIGNTGLSCKLLAVVDDFVVYRYKDYNPGIVTIKHFLVTFTRRSQAPVEPKRIRRVR